MLHVLVLFLSLLLLGLRADGFVDLPWLIAGAPLAFCLAWVLRSLQLTVDDLSRVIFLANLGAADE